MSQTIKIKRSNSNLVPSGTLAHGELAYGTVSGSGTDGKLSIGRPGTSAGSEVNDVIGGRLYTVAIDNAGHINNANCIIRRHVTDNSFASGKITVESGGVQVNANAATSTTAGHSNNWNTAYTLASAALGSGGGTMSGALLGTTASFSGTTALNNSSINLGFASGAAEIKAKGSSASPSAHLDLLRTNAAGNTLFGLRVLAEGGLSVGSGAITMDGNLEGVYALQMYGAISGATTINATSSVSVPTVNTTNLSVGTITGPSVMTIDPAGTGASGELVIQGSLTVKGTTTTIDSNTLSVGDSLIVLNGDETGTPSQNSGIEVERGTQGNVSLQWVETGTTSTSYWAVNDASGVSPNLYPLLHTRTAHLQTYEIEGGSF